MTRFLYAWAPDEGDDAGNVAIDNERGAIKFMSPEQADEFAESVRRAARYARGVRQARIDELRAQLGGESSTAVDVDDRPTDSTPGSGDSSAGGTNSTR